VEKAAKTIAKIAIRKPCEEKNMYISKHYMMSFRTRVKESIHLKTMFNTTRALFLRFDILLIIRNISQFEFLIWVLYSFLLFFMFL
jgi:hypothetical protein